MSQAAKLTLAGSALLAASTIFLVHQAQKAEKAAMHAGVIRDMEQQRLKQERQLDFEMQKAMEQEYRKIQSVHDGSQVLDKAP
ncbi:hypothetical protein F5884DRAFT_353337 [Xylogone sp. PMI_703]|nr:hypothetical protein F5884DRAFT_353337 [Xylogone sp. PMI_703]